MELRYIIDTTLRDGEQSPGFALNGREKTMLAKILDQSGVHQIEGGIPAMGKAEKNALLEMKSVCRQAKISAWNRLNCQDLFASFDCKPDIMHISVPVSLRQIYDKLKQDKAWIEKEMLICVDLARSKGYEVTVGFEDASAAEMEFMIGLAKQLKKMRVSYIRFADTLGILTPFATYNKIKQLREHTGMEIEFHGHNDLGMAVANSIAAAQAGALYVDVTLGGIGERTGNCSFAPFVKAAEQLYDWQLDSFHAEAAVTAAGNLLQRKMPV